MALDDITYSRYGIRVGLSRRALQESSLSSHTVVGSEANVGQHPAPVAQDSTPLLEDTSIPVCNAGGTGEENGLVVLNQARAEILKDLPRTYPTLGFYHDGGTMAQSLEGVLLIYVAEHPEQGYMQVKVCSQRLVKIPLVFLSCIIWYSAGNELSRGFFIAVSGSLPGIQRSAVHHAQQVRRLLVSVPIVPGTCLGS
jgi:hypothetical protein